MTYPLRSTGITPLLHYYRAVRPSPRIGTFGLAVGAACAFSLSIAGQVLHVPYKSQIELRAAYMPDAAWAVSVHPPSLSRKMGQPPVLTSSNRIDTSSTVHLRSPLPIMPAGILFRLFRNVHHHRFFTTAACGGLRSTPDCRPRRAILHFSYSNASPRGPALLVTQDPTCDFRSGSKAPF